MKTRFLAFAAFATLGFLLQTPASRAVEAPVEAPTETRAAPVYVGPTMTEVEQLVTVWHDNKRDRDVPVKIFYPRAKGPFPLLILSHGLGGNRDGLDYLGRYWAGHGYVCAQIQHLGTDESVWRSATTEQQAQDAMKKAGGNLNNILNRPRDVSFAIDQMLNLNANENSELSGKINPDVIGVAGHSLGGLTALFSAGQRATMGEISLDLSDPRIKACVAMSSPLNTAAPLTPQFAEYRLPTLTAVGADDNAVLGATINQRQIYDAVTAPDQYLMILANADHMTFAGERFGPDLPGDLRDHTLIQKATLAFWEAQLKENKLAENWLKNEFAAQLSAGSVFESK